MNSNSPVIGLLDVNNFYVSCERVFMPSLERKPVIVLSNNDGCVISRSNETKLLGIKMGIPYFKIKSHIEKHDIEVFSSNYALYNDMSRRVMHLLRGWISKIEVYSIDEAFLDFSDLKPVSLDGVGLKLVRRLKRLLGLPVSVGIAPTKTLAKIANLIAKKWPEVTGVYNLCNVREHKHVLSKIAVEDIWGVGRKSSAKLRAINIRTAEDLKNADITRIKHMFNKLLTDTILELQGISCIQLDEKNVPQKQIMVSRSFSHKLSDYASLRSALATHVTRASTKLRGQASLAQSILVFIRTNRFNSADPQYSNSHVVSFETPTDSTTDLIRYAEKALSQLFRPNYYYHKIGVRLFELIDKNTHQLDLFNPQQKGYDDKFMNTFDQINALMGTGTLRYGIERFESPWFQQGRRRTPAYTTCWKELPYVKAK
jgi:DNA polymerase V